MVECSEDDIMQLRMDIEQLQQDMMDRFALHEKALFIIDQKIDTAREELKKELHDALDTILTGQDKMVRILERLETEKVFLGERVSRVEQKIGMM